MKDHSLSVSETSSEQRVPRDTKMPSKSATTVTPVTGHKYKKVQFDMPSDRKSDQLIPEPIRDFINEKVTLHRQILTAMVIVILQSTIEMIVSTFYLICLFIASPGSLHHSSLLQVSFFFVYSGNLRHLLIISYFVIIVTSLVFFITCIIFLAKSMSLDSSDHKFFHLTRTWLFILSFYTLVKIVTFIFQNALNDLAYMFHFICLVVWIFFVIIDFLILALLAPAVRVGRTTSRPVTTPTPKPVHRREIPVKIERQPNAQAREEQHIPVQDAPTVDSTSSSSSLLMSSVYNYRSEKVTSMSARDGKRTSHQVTSNSLVQTCV